MSKKSLSILACVLVLLLAVMVAVGCSSASASNNSLILHQTDSGKTFTVKAGDTIKVTLPGNPTTGFTWQVVAPSGKALYKQLGDAVFKADSTALGAGGALTFEFQAMAKGEDTMKLVYSRPWESVPPAQTFEVKLSVE